MIGKLETLEERLGIGPGALAQLVGVDRATIHKWKNPMVVNTASVAHTRIIALLELYAKDNPGTGEELVYQLDVHGVVGLFRKIVEGIRA